MATPSTALELALALCGVGGVTATVAPPDWAGVGAAAIGGVIGALLSMAIFREEERRATWIKGGVSLLTSVAFAPFLFELLVDRGTLPPRAEAAVALSTFLSFTAWALLQLVHAIWLKWVRKRLEEVLGLPPARTPSRRAADRKDGAP